MRVLRFPPGALRASFTAPARRLAANSFWLVLARLGNQLLGAGFTLLGARALGVQGLGQYAWLSSLIFLANVATTFGTDTLLIRELAAHQVAGPVLDGALWLQLGLSAVWIFGLNAAAGGLSQGAPEVIHSLRIFSLSLVPLAFYTVYSAVLRARERMDLFLILNLFTAALQAAGALLILRAGGGLVELAGLLLAVQALSALLAWRLCARATGLIWAGPPARAPSLANARLVLDIARQAWPMALLASSAVLYGRLGVYLLSLLAGDAATGWFSAATRLIEALKLPHYAILGALFPQLARLARRPLPAQPLGRGAPSHFSSRRSVPGLLLAYALLVSLAVTCWAGPLVGLLFGPGYAPSAPVLAVLVWSLLPYSYTARASLELVAEGRERTVLAASLLAFPFTALLGLLLIPSHGPLGAGLACLSGEWFLAAALFGLSRRPSCPNPNPAAQL